MSTPDSLPPMEWSVSASPHIKDRENTPRIMWSVVAALAPAGMWGLYVFGVQALYVILLCVISAAATEAIIQRLRGRPVTLCDGSAVVTGLLLAYCLPSASPVIQNGQVVGLTWLKWQVPVVGAVVAIGIAKQCFGGLGHNIWNPALVGRAFVQLAYPSCVSLSQWPWPAGRVDAVTKATALAKGAPAAFSLQDLFIGNVPGCIGEISALFLLIGAAYLIARKYVNWRLPLGYLLALALFATLFAWAPRHPIAPWVNDFAASFVQFRGGELPLGGFASDWLRFVGMQIFAGGVILGAFFMATDMVTSPLTSRGQFIYGVGCGALTALIRFFSSYPEGVCYAILLMNTIRPYVDRWTRQRVIGQTR